jgi:uncharacterized protein YodC (DUF2158 family)
MEHKFNAGDLVKLKSNVERMNVIEYKVNHTGAVLNAVSGRKDYAPEVETDEVLCEWMYKGESRRRYFRESSLELVRKSGE